MPVDVQRTASDVRDGVRIWLAEQLHPVTNLEVSELSSTDGGLSSEMYFFSASWRDAAGNDRDQEFVIRIRPDNHQVIPDPDAIFQYELMKRIGEQSSVPVPRVWFAEPDATTIGSPFFVMERVPGTLFQPGSGTAWTPEQLATLYDNGLAMLADLHRIDPNDGFEFVGWPGETALDGVLAQATRWYTWTKAGRDLGILDVAFEWVKANRPHTTDSSICWGDARPGNILVNDDLSLAAVLDWEMAVLAPPEADLGWWLLFERAAYEGFGLPKPAGVPTRDETIAIYERHLGRSARDVRYYEILAGLRLGIISVRLLDLNGYGDLGAPWTLEETDDKKIVNCPFTRVLAEWLGCDVYGRPLA
ncbi:MAG: hypothetical protein JWQ77_1079 [Jatrophihabitans sp.]|nr:hypothetical protein [Jatrophihabitans sp.]